MSGYKARLAGRRPRIDVVPYAQTLAALFVGVAVCIVAIGCGDGGDEFEDAYVEANRALLESLPVPEFAELTGTEVREYRADTVHENPPTLPPIEGYLTEATYEVADGTTDEEVLAFYESQMGGWEFCDERVGIMEPVPGGQPAGTPLGFILLARFTLGVEEVGLNLSNLYEDSYAGTYIVSVDHDAEIRPCE